MENTKKQTPTYTNLLSFLVPLAFIPFMMNLGRQFTSRGMALMPDPVTTLAAYGLGFGLIQLLSSPFMQAQSLGLILVDSRQSFRQALKFIIIFSLVPFTLLMCMIFTPLGIWVIEDLHNVSSGLSAQVIFALLCLSPMPLLNSFMGLQRGMLINAKRTAYISGISLTVIITRIALVFILLKVEFVKARPILLPILVMYGGAFLEITMVGMGTVRRFRELPPAGENQLNFGYVFKFFWPLALVTIAVGSSRPLINLLVSRGADGEKALAVLAVVFPLASLPYGWINQSRSLIAAFREHKGSRKKIRKFVLACGLSSFSLMIILFWTPIRELLLLKLIGLQPDMAELCKWPLILFVFFPLTVMVRAYFQGIALVEHKTKAMSPSAPSRITTILAVYFGLSLTPLHGAVTGTAALLSGFAVEALVVRFCIRRARRIEKEQAQAV